MVVVKIVNNEKDLLDSFLPPVLLTIVSSYLSTSPEVPLETMRPWSQRYTLFKQPVVNADAAAPLLANVVRAKPVALNAQVRNCPESFFKKGQVTDLNGCTFYNVSPFQLMIFLRDDDMMRLIMPLIPKRFREIRQQQYAEIDSGGADLVKMDRDPATLPFEEVTRFITSYKVGNQPTEVTFPLLENPEGIICYLDKNTGSMHLYYANKKTQTIILLNSAPRSKQDEQALTELYDSFIAMEDNSSRRSSNAEHELIERLTGRKLSRKGIDYQDNNGGLFCDNGITFEVINIYRKNLKFADANNLKGRNNSWLQIGMAQRKVLWVLQRLCEKRVLYPLPDFQASPFLRGFTIYNYDAIKYELVCSDGALNPKLGHCLTVFSSNGGGGLGKGSYYRTDWDLIAVNQLVKNAKASVSAVELVEMIADDTVSNTSCGPNC